MAKDFSYTLPVRIYALSEAIADNLGEITPELEAQIRQLSLEVRNTTDLYRQLWLELEKRLVFYRSEARDFHEKARRAEVAIERLKERIKGFMQQAGKKRLEGERYGFTLKDMRYKVDIDEDIFPSHEVNPELWTQKTTYTVDKAEVLSRLQAGSTIPGATLTDVKALTPIDIIPEIKGEVKETRSLKGNQS